MEYQLQTAYAKPFLRTTFLAFLSITFNQLVFLVTAKVSLCMKLINRILIILKPYQMYFCEIFCLENKHFFKINASWFDILLSNALTYMC